LQQQTSSDGRLCRLPLVLAAEAQYVEGTVTQLESPGIPPSVRAFLRVVPIIAEPFARRHSVWAVRSALAVPGCWFAVAIALSSGHRGAYYPPSRPLVFHYPWLEVTASVVLMTAELVGVDLLLNSRRLRPVWMRALPTAVAAPPLSYSALLASMHAPPHVGIHQAWIVVFNIILAIFAITSGLIHAVHFACPRLWAIAPPDR